MDLSLHDAATRLGKSPRQVRYLIRQGNLRARKVGGRWLIASDDLPLTATRKEAQERKRERLREAVETGLGLEPEPTPRKRYSVRDLKAFQVMAPIHARAAQSLGTEHAATATLRESLAQLSCGCHRYDHAEKATAYGTARDLASRCLNDLLLETSPVAAELADSIEQELMPAFAGLLRRVDRRRRY
ncbi:MAG: helix-turn-helix domain-containing protein [Planctomycetota bacterium]